MNLGEGAGVPESVTSQQLQEAGAALAEVRSQLQTVEEELEREASTSKSVRVELVAEKDAHAKAKAAIDGLEKELDMAHREVEPHKARRSRRV